MRPVWFRQRIPDRLWPEERRSFLEVERLLIMGTNRAESAAVRRRVYATIRAVRQAPFQVFGQCQVFGHIDAGARSAGLFRCSEPLSSRRLRGVICVGRMSQAAEWLISVPGGIGLRRFWWRDSNVRDSTSAGKRSLKLNLACARSAMNGSRAFKRSLAFLSSSFSHRRFRIWTRNLLSVSLGTYTLAMPQRNPGPNAKS
jgi:hypothetical protein